MITKKQILNEVTSTSSDGKYYTSLKFGPKKWDKKQLGPFETPANIFTNAELAHDEKDGELSIPEEDAMQIEKETENISNKIEDEQVWPTPQMIDEEYEKIIIEDLRVWFGTKKKPKGSSQPKGPWVNICRKDKNGKHPPCGREKAESKGYPKCRAAGVASKMSDAEKRNACQQKRKAEKSNPKTGTGNKPTMVSHKKKVIEEAITDIVYHFTNVYNLNNILKTNKFYTKIVIGTNLEKKINKNKLFFFSTTRSKSEGFFKDRPGSVRIKLDGRKLSQRYKGFAIDYWGNSRQNKIIFKLSPELEDRIILDKPYIDNAINYITEISILIDDKQKLNLNYIEKICEANDIPLFIYDNDSDYSMNIKKNSLLKHKTDFKNDTSPNQENFKIKYKIPDFNKEWEEANRYDEFVKIGFEGWLKKAKEGYVTNYKKIKNFLGNVDLNFDDLENEKKERFYSAYNKGIIEMPIAVKFSEENYDLVGGNTRLAGLVMKGIDSKIWIVDISNIDETPNSLGVYEIRILKLVSINNPESLNNYDDRTIEEIRKEKINTEDLDEYIKNINLAVKRLSNEKDINIIYKLVKDMKKYNTKDISKYIKIKLELNETK